jgi:hypothetical protein
VAVLFHSARDQIRLLDDFQGTMVVAMAIVGVMQMPVNQIADMASVGNGFVTAIGPVDMVFGVA